MTEMVQGTASRDAILVALALPPSALHSLRVPKKLLAEQGAPISTNKRAIQDGIDELHWLATLKPTTIAVPAATEPGQEVTEIAVIAAQLRPTARVARLTELIHRAIPYPVLLLTLGGQNDTNCVLSVAPKRPALNEGGKLVVERVVATSPFDPLLPSPIERAFLDSLALAVLPARDLSTLYAGWLARIEALQAALLSGRYAVQDDPAAIEQRRALLDAHADLAREIVGLRSRAKRERQLNRLVDLNMQIQRLESLLNSHTSTLRERNKPHDRHQEARFARSRHRQRRHRGW
jgi:hypothetical protein